MKSVTVTMTLSADDLEFLLDSLVDQRDDVWKMGLEAGEQRDCWELYNRIIEAIRIGRKEG